MARTVATIQASMDAEQANQPTLTSNLTSASQVSIFKLWKYITSVIANIQEQLWDLFVVDMEKKIKAAAVGSEYWMQQKTLEFQYSATTPQVMTLVNFAPQYAVVNTALRIITRCSVKTGTSKTVSVKVAKSEPPVALSAGELSSLVTYLTNGGNSTTQGVGLGFAGIYINVQSLTADKLFIEGTITYDGQYSAVIQSTVIAAIKNYLAKIDFDGSIKVLNLIDAIQLVAGVTDISIVNLAIRADATAFSGKTFLIQGSTTLYTTYPTFAGYVVEETTANEMFTNKLTFTPAS